MSILTTKLGIDLGTANTLVYLPGKGIVLNEPSVVAVNLIDNKVVAVGTEAKDMVGKAPDTIMVYKPMKDGVIADYRITEAMLRYYIGKSISRFNLFKPDVMVSVPAGVTSTERRAVIEATIKAGAKNAYVVKEPILAAIGAGIPIYEACGHMVVDIGGGTTDVAIISLGGIVSSTSVKHAGNKIDQAIADYIKKTFNLAIGDKTAEEVKISVGSAIPVEDEMSYTIKGRDFMTGLPRSAEVRTNEIVRAIDNELKEVVRAIKTVFQDTPPELSADVIDQGITLTGGSSQLRNLAELIYRKTGVKAYLAEDALYCVAKGTGIALDHLDVYKRSIISKR
ncbi:MAG TPA: rod shape-determining protein [Candidatus Paceibacterota bacterium]|nr:rod shape-determining protein [Candidatus Paceibacterota bacterium]